MPAEQKIVINTAAIPDCYQRILAGAAFDMVRRIQSQPGGREALEAKKAEIRAARAGKE